LWQINSKDQQITSEKILRFVEDNPGCHLRQIKGDLGIAMGTVQYKLGRLDKAGKIRSKRHGLYRYYFSATVLKNQEDILEALTQETSREILMFIIERVNPTQTEISDNIMISSASVNWHIRRLTELSLISQEIDGKYKRYHLVKDSRIIIALLKSYYPSIWDRWSDRLAEMFLSMSSTATGKDNRKEDL
jgi:predicted transcriptional regulator